MVSPLTELRIIMTRNFEPSIEASPKVTWELDLSRRMTDPDAAYGKDSDITQAIEEGRIPLLFRDLEALIPTLRIGDKFHGKVAVYTVLRLKAEGAYCHYQGDGFSGKLFFNYREFCHSRLERCIGGL